MTDPLFRASHACNHMDCIFATSPFPLVLSPLHLLLCLWTLQINQYNVQQGHIAPQQEIDYRLHFSSSDMREPR